MAHRSQSLDCLFKAWKMWMTVSLYLQKQAVTCKNNGSIASNIVHLDVYKSLVCSYRYLLLLIWMNAAIDVFQGDKCFFFFPTLAWSKCFRTVVFPFYAHIITSKVLSVVIRSSQLQWPNCTISSIFAKVKLVWFYNGHPRGILAEVDSNRLIYDAAVSKIPKLAEVVGANEWCWPPGRSDQLVGMEGALCGSFAACTDKEDMVILTGSRSWEVLPLLMPGTCLGKENRGFHCIKLRSFTLMCQKLLYSHSWLFMTDCKRWIE